MRQRFVGFDVSINWLDIHHPDQGSRRIETAPAAVQAFAAATGVVFQATGGYDAPLRVTLEAAGVRFSRVDPRQTRDGGKRSGHRGIAGGPVVRAMLYVAARHAPAFGALRNRLKAAGKPVKLALVATAHKLLRVLNAMLANGTDCSHPEPA